MTFQNLGLSEIEAIVADIEREKEAGWLLVFGVYCPINSQFLQRRKESVRDWLQLLLDRPACRNGWESREFVQLLHDSHCYVSVPKRENGKDVSSLLARRAINHHGGHCPAGPSAILRHPQACISFRSPRSHGCHAQEFSLVVGNALDGN